MPPAWGSSGTRFYPREWDKSAPTSTRASWQQQGKTAAPRSAPVPACSPTGCCVPTSRCFLAPR